MPVCHNCFLAYSKIDYFRNKLFMHRAINEKNYVKNLKYPQESNIEEEKSDDLGLNFCPKRKKLDKGKKYKLINAHDAHLPVKKKMILE